MAENRRGKDKRFYFSRGQLVLLGGAFTLAAVVIFFLGMFVGKGMEARKAARSEEPLVKIPVTPSAQGAGGALSGQAREELTFYDTLTRSPGTKAAQTPADERQKAAAEPGKPSAAGIKESKRPAKEDALVKAAEKRAEKAEATTKSLPAESAERGENGKSWTVQVNAFPDPRSAKIWVDRLKNKGYNAYSTEVLNKGKTWYRVRVGRYGTREEAEKAEESLRTKENFTKAFVTNR